MANPLAAVQAAPGGGKSFFLDELAALRKEDITSYSRPHKANEECLQWTAINRTLLRSVAVSITYNSDSPYYKAVDCEPSHGLALRMLWAYFMRQESSWPEFCELCIAHLSRLPTPHQALAAILRHRKSDPVLLCVDELIKATLVKAEVQDAAQSVVYEVGVLLSHFGYDQFNAIVTTLDFRPLREEGTRLGRPIAWVSLPSLALKGALSLFKPLWSGLNYRRRLVLAMCVSDCNGHPRSLEYLYRLLRTDRSARHSKPYTVIMDTLVQNLGEAVPSYAVVKAALAGKAMPLDTEIGRSPLSELIAKGTYINTSVTGASMVVPKLSPLLLRAFAYDLPIDRDARLVVTCLNSMLWVEINFNPLLYEDFHASWEIMHHILHEDTSDADRAAITLPQFYGLKVGHKLNDTRFIPTRKEGVARLAGHFPSPDALAEITKPESLLDFVFLPAANNPGFDIVFFEKKEGGGHVAINIECRYSEEGATTALSESDVTKKYDLVRSTHGCRTVGLCVSDLLLTSLLIFLNLSYTAHTEAYQPFVDGQNAQTPVGMLNLSMNDVFLVVCSCARGVRCTRRTPS